MLDEVQLRRTRAKHDPLGYRLEATVWDNPDWPHAAKDLGGRMLRDDSWRQIWVFPSRAEERVNALCTRIWGTTNSAATRRATVHWNLTLQRHDEEAWLGGRLIAKRHKRDTKPTLGREVVLISGGFEPRGGYNSMPRLEPLPDTVVEIRNLPLAAAHAAADLGAVIVDTHHEDTAALRSRHEYLLTELAEVSALLRRAGAHVSAGADSGTCRCGGHTCPPDGYTISEVATLTGLNPNTIRGWCAEGSLPALRTTRGWIIAKPLPARVGRIVLVPAEPDETTASLPAQTRAELGRRHGVDPQTVRTALARAQAAHEADPTHPTPPQPVNPGAPRPRYDPVGFDRWWHGRGRKNINAN
ncbi:helix-turn-helix domain-containing protein [Kitasatospora sp. NPDC002965]|uniref:helix-turn-helix domain-containing protein n=1 Tax=Kitasatospora sp. NPDC002965 TaxID=3154775 RepID=UPI0033A838DB